MSAEVTVANGTERDPAPAEVMALIEAARASLQRVEDPREAARIVKQADAIKYLAQKADASQETQNQAAEVALRARRRMGEILSAVPREPRSGAGRPPKIGVPAEPQFTEPEPEELSPSAPLPAAAAPAGPTQYQRAPLPSAKTLSQEYGVAIGTVTRAFNALVAEGLIRNVAGRGMWVVPRA